MAVADGIPDEVVALLAAYFEAAAASGTPRFDHLRATLLQLYRRRRIEGASADASCAETSSFHGVVFVEQRLMAHVVAWYVGNYDRALAACFNTAVIHADTPATHLLRMTKAQGRKSIDRFRTKEANLLVATNAAEEGMDIPEANAVVRFDPISTAVSLVQGRGRAREAHSDFVVLDERHNRTVAALQDAERNQSTFIQQAFGDTGVVGSASNIRSESELKASAMQSQVAREAANCYFLRQHFDSPTQLLNTFCQKVRLSTAPTEGGSGTHFDCTVRVTSITFGSIIGHGTSTSKKGARDAASADAVQQLRAHFNV
jgi:superfamily II DNA/RNA helicase